MNETTLHLLGIYSPYVLFLVTVILLEWYLYTSLKEKKHSLKNNKETTEKVHLYTTIKREQPKCCDEMELHWIDDGSNDLMLVCKHCSGCHGIQEKI